MVEKARQQRWRRVFTISAVALGVVSILLGARLAFGASPIRASETLTSATTTGESTPSASPTPSATHAVKPEPCTVAQISAPSIGLNAEVGEYTYEQAVAAGGVNPARMTQAVWYSGYYRHDGIYSVMSARAEDTVYVYGHSTLDLDEGAVFDHLTELGPGDTVTVTACGETIPLVVEQTFDLDKADFSQDPRIYSPKPQPGTWVLATCDRDGPRQNGHTTRNTAVVLHLTPPPRIKQSNPAR